MYNVKSLKAEEFISDEEIKETLEYAEANKNNIGPVSYTHLDVYKRQLEGLKEEGIEEGKNLKVDYQDAQTDTGTASTIADSFVSEKVDMICAIATPCATSAYNSAMNADIPTVYTAVSDPCLLYTSYIEILEKKSSKIDMPEEIVVIIHKLSIKIKNSVRLINQFFNLAQIESGDIKYDIKKYNFST